MILVFSVILLISLHRPLFPFLIQFKILLLAFNCIHSVAITNFSSLIFLTLINVNDLNLLDLLVLCCKLPSSSSLFDTLCFFSLLFLLLADICSTDFLLPFKNAFRLISASLCLVAVGLPQFLVLRAVLLI